MSGKQTMLCVDDEANVLRSLQRVFFDEGYDFITAGSAREGLEALGRREDVQVVMSDYRMPGMNGVDFLREVNMKWPETVRIVLSGYADTPSVVSAINEGQIYKFIPKPWDDNELKVAIANAFERHELRRNNSLLTAELLSANEELSALNEGLERLVEARTSEMQFQNRVLARSQHILDSLPVAVVGIDSEGNIVQCNEAGLLMFKDKGITMGIPYNDIFDNETAELMASMLQDGSGPVTRSFETGTGRCRAKQIRHIDGNMALTLIFDLRETNG
jgi:two-component system NtrC family sensor kinase